MSDKLWIDGRWTASQGGGELKVENPATGEVVDSVIDASTADVDNAVKAANNSLGSERTFQRKRFSITRSPST
jgi:succinate-semialdehyde dehydrogenase/glutarate-semialdehyde dehydrogenase